MMNVNYLIEKIHPIIEQKSYIIRHLLLNENIQDPLIVTDFKIKGKCRKKYADHLMKNVILVNMLPKTVLIELIE